MPERRRPGRDRRAVRLPARLGRDSPAEPRSAIVVGGGIAGLAAAVGLAERGVRVRLVEPERELGGRVRAWRVRTSSGEVSMSRGFHAFFRQYYNLRTLLARAGDPAELLRPVADYPVVGASGDRDSFARIPRTPPWSFIGFVARSPTFTARDLARVDLDAALSLLDVRFPDTYRAFDGESAAGFLDRLRFPPRARHLALEVFARSFFADPREFSAGELVAMFHAYFLGSAEGLLFDVPRDDFDRTLWSPLWAALERLGATRTIGRAVRVEREEREDAEHAPGGWRVVLDDGACLTADAVVLAAGPRGTRRLVAASPALGDPAWRTRLARVESAPPFAVLRLWTDRPVRADRPAFLGTTSYGILDNVSVLERFEDGAAAWAREHGGSVLELHAYALRGEDVVERASLRERLLRELGRVYPETRGMAVRHEELLVEDDCALIGTGPWAERPGVRTPQQGVVLAGDWLRCPLPVALMERAATTGWRAANALLADWGVAGHELWSVPVRARQTWPGVVRRLLRRLPGRARPGADPDPDPGRGRRSGA